MYECLLSFFTNFYQKNPNVIQRINPSRMTLKAVDSYLTHIPFLYRLQLPIQLLLCKKKTSFIAFSFFFEKENEEKESCFEILRKERIVTMRASKFFPRKKYSLIPSRRIGSGRQIVHKISCTTNYI